MSAPKSRPVHPCYLSVFDGTSGAEYATWANITSTKLPNLVTAQSSTITVYDVDESWGKLLVKYQFPQLAGNVCYLETLKSPTGPDALLVGFAGHPRLSIVSVTSDKLLATTLLDLTPALQERCYGAVTPLEQDLQGTLLQNLGANLATVCVILGGGVAVACVELRFRDGWSAAEPYLLPLQSLSELESTASAVAANINANTASITTGFGDILSATFLPGYLEPTLLLLHSNPESGRTWSGRLGRAEGGTRFSMILTAITVTVTHERSAVLWKTEVPADGVSVYAAGDDGCLVHCVNEIVSVSNTGQIKQCLAVNGWAKSGLSSYLENVCRANPWPFPQLSISLDGASFAFLNPKTAFVTLRAGQVFLLQYTSCWSFLPLYNTIGAVGQVSNLISWPLGELNSSLLKENLIDKEKLSKNVEMGLLFVGSRMGDSTMLGYALESTSVADALKNDPGLQKPKTDERVVENDGDEYEQMLQMEEDALYAPSEGQDRAGPNIIPPSDDEEDYMLLDENTQRKRARLSSLMVIRSLTVLDSLTGLGPLGPGCMGPISGSPDVKPDAAITPAYGYIFPCGYGSSGGLALLTSPGRDDRTIVAEEDCVNAKALFTLEGRGLVLISTAESGVLFMKLESGKKIGDEDGDEYERCLVEVDLWEWATEETLGLLRVCTLLAACERDDGGIVLVVAYSTDASNRIYSLLVLHDTEDKLEILGNDPIPVPDECTIVSATPMTKQGSEQISFAYCLSSGDAKFITMDATGCYFESDFKQKAAAMEIGDEEVSEEENYYQSDAVVAIDMFQAPKSFFGEPAQTKEAESPSDNAEEIAVGNVDDIDEDEKELYGEIAKVLNEIEEQVLVTSVEEINTEETCFVAVVRQSGSLEIYLASDVEPGNEPSPIWKCSGCGHGVPELKFKGQTGSSYRSPRMHKICTAEIRFFFCGISAPKFEKHLAAARPFCVLLETSAGDSMLYTAEIDTATQTIETFRREQLKCPSRPSQEQSKHFSKLRRKGIVSNKDPAGAPGDFRHNLLHRFQRLSGQDGIFAGFSRPFWLVAERGRPLALNHRSRHVAPAGSKPRPVSGFCSGLQVGGGKEGFMTLHERVGRVGSQRLTVFSGILNLESTHGIIPGGGFFVEKIPMGVTVRRIQFVDDPKGGVSHFYAVLVSRELEVDCSHLNDDGLSQEERQRLIDEKENAKIKRQVEADLGGFDMEQEWVEEIEREDCFKVDTKLGGAPPVQKSAYSLWIVDSTNGWVVVDSYELEEFEHALTMQVMLLSEFTAEPGSAEAETISEEELATRQFITIGTGIVDKDGEDVSSKGRVVLLEVKRSISPPSIELNFVYEKNIFHGPVSSLSCLSSHGNTRLVIGAGADVNIEQWGNDKLTQVGFFRATMHILDIKLFKNFFVLCDAYDSLHFLVWRESDKSLTLLAKDYDPIPVYAAGLLSRGGSLDIVCQDDRQNLQFFQYAPGDAAARGGNKLVCRADFHLGSQTIDLQSFFCRSSLLVNSATPTSTLAALQQQDTFFGRTDDDQRLGVHFGTTDGGYGVIIPLSEPVYWRLTALQSVMVNALESDCALSQRAWRLYRRTPRRGGCRSNDRKKGVIDGDLVIVFPDLPIPDQEDLASAIGSTVELIIDNLLELKCSSMVI